MQWQRILEYQLNYSELDSLVTEVTASHFAFPNPDLINEDAELWIELVYREANPEVLDHLLQVLAVALPSLNLSFDKEMLCCLDNPDSEAFACWRSQTRQQQSELAKLFSQGQPLVQRNQNLLLAQLGEVGAPRLLSFLLNPCQWLINRAKSAEHKALVQFVEAIKGIQELEEWSNELVLALPWICDQLKFTFDLSKRLSPRNNPAPNSAPQPAPRIESDSSSSQEIPDPVPFTSRDLHEILTSLPAAPTAVPPVLRPPPFAPLAAPPAVPPALPPADYRPVSPAVSPATYRPVSPATPAASPAASRAVSPVSPFRSQRLESLEQLAKEWNMTMLEQNLPNWMEEDYKYSEIRLPQFERFTKEYLESLDARQKLFLGQLIEDRSTKCGRELAALDKLGLKQEFIGLKCTICREYITDDTPSEATTCAHVFHTECLETWLKGRHTCPQCREPQPNLE